MTISGFSIARNANTLYYPIAASIRSVLPICDEFIIAIGAGDPGDRTRAEVEAIGDPKIKIIDTHWPDFNPQQGHPFAQQTDLALAACQGDWCLYLQSDEVIHEKYLPLLRTACEQSAGDPAVEGFLLEFKHFWGDYDHYLISHCWYPLEIRCVRNRIGVTAYRDAQSFRRDGRRLQVVQLAAEVFHYGWVRPPRVMQQKRQEFTAADQGTRAAAAQFDGEPHCFDYGSLQKLPRFTETHPAVMRDWIARFNWKDQLDYQGRSPIRHKQDRWLARLHTTIEQKLLGGRPLFGFHNYKIVAGKKITCAPAPEKCDS